MFGTLRFFLACLVVVTHTGLSLGPEFLLGPAAVVIFYIISGYVIAALLVRIPIGGVVCGFYGERLLRIFPQFWVHLVVSVALIGMFGSVSDMTSGAITPANLGLNVALFPIQFRKFFENIEHVMYVPTSWSLSLEISFYVVAPWVLRIPALMIMTALLSAALFALGVAGIIDPHTFTYATIFGTAHFFLLGAWLQRRQYWYAGSWAVLALALYALAHARGTLDAPHIQETLIGGVAGLVLVALLAEIKHPRFLRADAFLGRISFPIFLNHFIAIWGVTWLGFTLSPVTLTFVVLPASLLMGVLAFIIVERPIDAFRRRLRELAR